MIRFDQVNARHGSRKLDSASFLEIFSGQDDNKYSVQLTVLNSQVISELSVDFFLGKVPSFYRSADYEWAEMSTNSVILSNNSSRILKFDDGQKMMALSNFGAWEVFPQKQKLRWHLIHPDLTPSFTYDEADKRIWHREFSLPEGTQNELNFFCTYSKVPEWARTPMGFLPTVCFTDHCDFDTPELLLSQREILKECGIRITKGIFLYDYSHHPFTASLEHPGILVEFKKWENDGHELAYHAFSKSEGPESDSHFQNYQSPSELQTIETYIDHGFLSYNATRQKPEDLCKWAAHQIEKGIKLNWNYVDAFEATANCTNQLAPIDSSIAALWKSKSLHQKLGLPEDTSRLFKAWLSYGTNEDLDFAVKRLQVSLSKAKNGEQNAIGELLKNGLSSLGNSLDSKMWKRNLFNRTTPNHFSSFSTVFYKNPLFEDRDIWSFQTASLKNYEAVFSQYGLDKMQREKGVLIAHTYLAYTGQNHQGRLFLNESGEINPKAKSALKELGNLIRQGKVWNPTVKEMHHFYRRLFSIEYKIEGDKICVENCPAPIRFID